MKYLVLLGVAPEKITLGLPTSGRAYQLIDGDLNSIGAPTVDPSLTVAYSDICKLFKSVTFIRVDDRRSRSTYFYNSERKRWISSDTIDDFKLKVRRFSPIGSDRVESRVFLQAFYAQAEGLRGVTLSLLDADDLNAQCSEQSYPLLRAAANVFGLKGTPPSDSRLITPSDRTPILCSISSHAEFSQTSMSFSLDKLNDSLCTHLLIDHQSRLLTRTNVEALKRTNRNLKVLMSVSSTEANNLDLLNETYRRNRLDGINVQLSLTPSAKSLTALVKVNVGSTGKSLKRAVFIRRKSAALCRPTDF